MPTQYRKGGEEDESSEDDESGEEDNNDGETNENGQDETPDAFDGKSQQDVADEMNGQLRLEF